MSEDPLSWDTTEKTLVEMGESESNAAAGVIAAVVVGVLATIALLFSFALLIDCRNKKKALKQQQNHPTKRMSPAKRAVFPQFISNSSSNRDNLSFVNQMCTDSTSTPPVVLAGRSEDLASGTDVHHKSSFPSSSSSITPHSETV